MSGIPLERRVSSLPAMFSFLRERLRQWDVGPETTFEVELLGEELFTNLIRHNVPAAGSPQVVHLDLEVDEKRIVVRFTDFGVEPWDVAPVPAPNLEDSIAQRRPGQFGLRLVGALADDVEYSQRGRDMHVAVHKARRKQDV